MEIPSFGFHKHVFLFVTRYVRYIEEKQFGTCPNNASLGLRVHCTVRDAWLAMYAQPALKVAWVTYIHTSVSDCPKR